MKKTLLTIIVTVCVMFIGFTAYINKIENSYEAKLEEANDLYEMEMWLRKLEVEDTTNDLNDVTEEYNELQNQVWNMMNDNAYNVRVEHDDKVYHYRSDNKGLFPSKSVTITY